MKRNPYVLDHDFGYGKERENDELTKLELRNIDELKCYVKDRIDNTFIADVKDFTVKFKSETPTQEVLIEII
ncbi:MAG: hypothetical protein ACI4R8_03640 [Candidatus Caccovivens sp.]